MRTTRAVVLAAASVAAYTVVTACGGGGGGGGSSPADVTGKVLVASTGAPPSTATTVTIGGSSTPTAADGTFTLTGVSSTSTAITVASTGLPTLTQPLPTLSPRPALNNLGAIFVSDAGYTAQATGTVVRSDTLAVVSGARVQISGQVVVTGADGTFSFSGLPVNLGGPDTQIGLITASGFDNKPIIQDPPLGASPPVNAMGELVISPPVGTIPGGPVDISGVVTLQGSTDASGVTVTLIRKSDGLVLGSLTTDSTGKYGFWVVTGVYTVTATKIGYVPGTVDITLSHLDQPQTHNFALATSP